MDCAKCIALGIRKRSSMMKFVWTTMFLRNLLRLKYPITPSTVWKLSVIIAHPYNISPPSNPSSPPMVLVTGQWWVTGAFWCSFSSGASSLLHPCRFSEQDHPGPRQKWRKEELRLRLSHPWIDLVHCSSSRLLKGGRGSGTCGACVETPQVSREFVKVSPWSLGSESPGLYM